MKLNKGEWAELLVALLLLKEKQCFLYESSTIMKINKIGFFKEKLFSQYKSNINLIDKMKKELTNKNNTSTFTIKQVNNLIKKLQFKKGSSRKKTDIIVEHVINNTSYTSGFSIKSMLNKARPTLLNASQATNFLFQIPNSYSHLTGKPKEIISNIPKKLIKFQNCANKKFLENLKMVDSSMDIYIAKILISYYRGEPSDILNLINTSFPSSEVNRIRKRLEDFLYYICVGMFPVKAWDGTEEVMGGIILEKDCSLTGLHKCEINNFKKFLLHSTKLETASTSRHKHGVVFNEGKKSFIKLNLQVRLK